MKQQTLSFSLNDLARTNPAHSEMFMSPAVPAAAVAGYAYPCGVSMFGAAVVAGVSANVAAVANRLENGRIAAAVHAWDTTEGALSFQALTCTTKKSVNKTKTIKRPQSWCGAPPG
jgi:hypothetical protein